MTSAIARPWSREEFLEWDALQHERFEFVDGRVRSMVGETLAPNRIVKNTAFALHRHLTGTPCEVFIENVKVLAAADSFYPDLVVACGEQDDQSSLVNRPVAIFEVSSRLTRTYDRGRKWHSYQAIASLEHYVLISQFEPQVEVLTRDRAAWTSAVFRSFDAAAPLARLDLALPLSEVYAGVGFRASPAAGA